MGQRIILAGGGHAHLPVLADWARHPFPGTDRWLVTASRYTVYSGMLPGWIVGNYEAGALRIDLKPLAERAGAQLILAEVTGLDAPAQKLILGNGECLQFDLLSLATGGELERTGLAALGDRLLTIRPVESFMAQWTAFLSAHATADAPCVAVVGGGAGGVELALAVRAALDRKCQNPRVVLVTPEQGFLAGHAQRVRRRVLFELEQRAIAVHFAMAAGVEGGLALSDGSMVAADCVIAATGSQAPHWLAQSGLACSESGFVAVGADLRSISHPAIFAAGDVSERVDRPLARSGVHAVKAGPVLAKNLRAAAIAAPLAQYQPRRRTLYLLATGDRHAVLSWGKLAAWGQWVWTLKDWIDRTFVGRYTKLGTDDRKGEAWQNL